MLEHPMSIASQGITDAESNAFTQAGYCQEDISLHHLFLLNLYVNRFLVLLLGSAFHFGYVWT